VGSVERPEVSTRQLSDFCRSRLGSDLSEALFEKGYSSAVFGVRLSNGREVVLKWRAWRERLRPCHDVQRRMWESGFPCPEPLMPPVRLGDVAVSAEALLRGGSSLDRGLEAAARLGGALAAFVGAAPTLASVTGPLGPDMGFLRWSHPGTGLWPRATDVAADVQPRVEPEWLTEHGQAVRERLRRVPGPLVVGHGDWWSDNVRWDGARLLAVDDWDSVVALPEPALAGAAAALHGQGSSSLAETETFLDAYADARGRAWTPDDLEVAWAAGLWARLFDAHKDAMLGWSGGADRLQDDVDVRAGRAGL
jgi:hypothetical protein